MAKAPTPPPAPKILPLPKIVLEHHGKTLFRSMQQWLSEKRVPPVLLLTGPAGVGKRSIIHFLSQWLLCEKTGFQSVQESEEAGLFGGDLGLGGPTSQPQAGPPGEDPLFPCGKCPNCQRALSGNWVDFIEIGGETEEGETGSLKIDQFRKLKASLGFGSYDGAFKITLIRDADRMTVQAANSLLKILEEPPPGWIFFLTASDATLLLPTLVSRCQKIRLTPFSTEQLEALLAEAGAPAERRRISAELAQGSWKRALALCDDEVWEKREEILGFLENPQATFNALIDWAAQDPKHLEMLFDQVEQVTSLLVRWTLEPSKALPRGLLLHAQAVTRKAGSTERARVFWSNRAERIFRARQEALAPINKKLLLQDVLAPWLQI